MRCPRADTRLLFVVTISLKLWRPIARTFSQSRGPLGPPARLEKPRKYPNRAGPNPIARTFSIFRCRAPHFATPWSAGTRHSLRATRLILVGSGACVSLPRPTDRPAVNNACRCGSKKRHHTQAQRIFVAGQQRQLRSFRPIVQNGKILNHRGTENTESKGIICRVIEFAAH